MMMLNYFINACLLLSSLLERKVCAKSCPIGQFGTPCKLQCNCERSKDCDDDGQCPNNEPCKSPYFGPSCQHEDLLITYGSANIPKFVSDRNHSTCNPDSKAKSFHISFVQPQTFTWFRLHVSNNIPLFYRNFTVKVDMSIRTNKLFRVHETALDVVYSILITATNIAIEGPVVPYICTINVSGGRNVARNQCVKQSSNYAKDPLEKVRAENAIDGNNSTDYDSGSCSRTEFEKTTDPHWNITFDRDYRLHRTLIYNANVNMSWLFKFKIIMYNNLGKPIRPYSDTSPLPLSVYTVVIRVGSPIHAMKIIADSSSGLVQVLLICEVQVFAEATCPYHTYGLQCEHKCQCAISLKCSYISGNCEYTPFYYCPPGTHGELCELQCPEHCQYNVCDVHSGACLGCLPGYLGQFCDKVCDVGKYGPNCSLNCSIENCAEPCDHITGLCSCVETFAGDRCTDCNKGWFGENCTEICPGRCLNKLCDNITGDCISCIGHWTGPKCEDCEQGWFGESCTRTCPRICPNNLCDNITGECVSCIGQRLGPKCEDCPAGHYGALCDMNCSVYCRDRSCDKVDGICHACLGGYRGEYCNLEIEEAYPSVFVLPLIIPFLILTLCCCLAQGGNIPSEED